MDGRKNINNSNSKEMPSYLKSEPRAKRPAAKLKKVSAKQSKNLLAYVKGKHEKYGDGQNVCTGCGTG